MNRTRLVLAMLPAQTVGGQTVGPATAPVIATINGVPVLGTVTIGGEIVGPITIPSYTLPQETVGPATAGHVPTGLEPIVVTIHGQSATLPFSQACATTTANEARNHTTSYATCVRTNAVNDIVNNGYIWTALDCAW